MRKEIYNTKRNIEKLLTFCLADRSLWERRNWSEKPIEIILEEIVREPKTSSSSSYHLVHDKFDYQARAAALLQ